MLALLLASMHDEFGRGGEWAKVTMVELHAEEALEIECLRSRWRLESADGS